MERLGVVHIEQRRNVHGRWSSVSMVSPPTSLPFSLSRLGSIRESHFLEKEKLKPDTQLLLIKICTPWRSFSKFASSHGSPSLCFG
ncbi:hypothetical protein N665_0143s0012 [Sinapis alba]|nr:hypothetical protein N665_0143s0012 [Sinapis alba]